MPEKDNYTTGTWSNTGHISRRERGSLTSFQVKEHFSNPILKYKVWFQVN